jgi:5'-nucleotidase
MRILVSNDDGYLAPGIRCLARVLSEGHEVEVVAPDRDRSGASNSLTLEYPVRPRVAENGFVFVDGTPTDCVHLAITGLLDREPDIVISGINSNANLGDDVLYSGTVAAAMEGRFLGLPAIAVSLVHWGHGHYETAARVVTRLLDHMSGSTIPPNTILNINVPDLPFEALTGIEATRLGHRHRSEPVVKSRDPRGQTIYWVGPPGAEQDAGVGTDFHAVREGRVSVTPLQVDLTRHDTLAGTGAWLKTVGLK